MAAPREQGRLDRYPERRNPEISPSEAIRHEFGNGDLNVAEGFGVGDRQESMFDCRSRVLREVHVSKMRGGVVSTMLGPMLNPYFLRL